MNEADSQMVTVRLDDLAECLRDAVSHLHYWGEGKGYEVRLQAIVDAANPLEDRAQ